jgi:putative Ca2+/H+ antiporter (TMEM165/GDT1 family)
MEIIAGIFVATIANHFLAALIGSQAASLLDGPGFRLIIAASFIAMAAWTLIPDKLDDEPQPKPARFGAFVATTIAFFLVEMGDKTQIATVALAARYSELLLVVLGTTLGMMLANVPAVFLGDKIAQKVSMRLVHGVAAAIFAVLGVLTLFNVGALF